MIATRFDAMGKAIAAAMLALLLGAMAASALVPQAPLATTATTKQGSQTDAGLYRAIAARVSAGENYYDAAASEHRKGGYPLKPFVTVRLPTLALMTGWLGADGLRAALLALIGLTVLAWYIRLREAFASRPAAVAATLPIAISASMLAIPVLGTFHEAWAALLVALSIALHRTGRAATAVALGLAAALFRETAFPFLLLMGSVALWEQRWREALGWATSAIIFAGFLMLHAQAVASVALPGDLASPGWSGLGGWGFLASALLVSTPLAYIPATLAKALIPLSLFGWAAWNSATGLRTAGWLGGVCLMLMLFARPDTFYWALLLTPLFLGGLALAVPALISLSRRIAA